MGVYIEGMEMPKDGFVEIIIKADGTVQQTGQTLRLAGDYFYTAYVGERPPMYKAVHIPGHGRLIDADARVNVQVYNDEFEDFQTVNMSIDDLLDSSWIELEDDSTIIPAEEGE